MKVRNYVMMVLGALTMFSASQVFGLGAALGPFQLDLDVDGGYSNGNQYTNDQEQQGGGFEDPICYAIENRKQLEVVLETTDQVSKNETKRTLKKVTIEPYLLGRNKKGQPILRGNVVSDEVLREVTINYPNGTSAPPEKQRRAPIAGWFHSPSEQQQTGKGVGNLNIRRVGSIKVPENSSFKTPKDFNKVFQEDVAEVTCSVTPAR